MELNQELIATEAEEMKRRLKLKRQLTVPQEQSMSFA